MFKSLVNTCDCEYQTWRETTDWISWTKGDQGIMISCHVTSPYLKAMRRFLLFLAGLPLVAANTCTGTPHVGPMQAAGKQWVGYATSMGVNPITTDGTPYCMEMASRYAERSKLRASGKKWKSAKTACWCCKNSLRGTQIFPVVNMTLEKALFNHHLWRYKPTNKGNRESNAVLGQMAFAPMKLMWESYSLLTRPQFWAVYEPFACVVLTSYACFGDRLGKI